MASVNPSDLNPVGAEIIYVTGPAVSSVPFLKKRMRVTGMTDVLYTCIAVWVVGLVAMIARLWYFQIQMFNNPASGVRVSLWAAACLMPAVIMQRVKCSIGSYCDCMQSPLFLGLVELF